MKSMSGIAERMAGLAKGEAAPPKSDKAAPAGKPGKHTTLHESGGGYRTESSDGESVEHPTIGHALMHMAAKHGEGKHAHASQADDGGYTTHQVSTDDGTVQGPHDHENLESLKESLAKFFDEEGSEDSEYNEKPGGKESLFG